MLTAHDAADESDDEAGKATLLAAHGKMLKHGQAISASDQVE